MTRLNIDNRRSCVFYATRFSDNSRPITLTELGRTMQMKFLTPALIEIRKFWPCIAVALFGVAVSLTVGGMTANRESQYAAEQFSVVAENHFMVVQNGLNEYVNRLRAVRALFDSSETPISRDGFTAFTKPLLLEATAIATLSWVPRVPNSERARFELEGAIEGLANYQIKMMGQGGHMAPSPKRDEYYPVFYCTLPKTSPLYGLDLRSEPDTLAEMDGARDDDRLGFSRIATLVSSGGTRSGFLFSLPVYRRGVAHDSVDLRRQNLVGFVHGSLVTSKMIDAIVLNGKIPVGLDSYFFDPGAEASAAPVYVYGSRLRNAPLQPKSESALMAGAHWSRALMADGQPWLLMEIVPMADGPLAAHHDRAWIVLLFGLTVTAGMVVYIQSSRRYASRMVRANQKVSDLAQTDALTGLANRRAFTDRLNAAFAASRRGVKPFAVLYFDIDHFKDVNDTLGHAAGDALLRQVAARVVGSVRGNDVVARIGGDEFTILQTDADDATAAGVLADKTAILLGKPYVIGGNEVHITVSLGISYYEPETAGPDAMMI